MMAELQFIKDETTHGVLVTVSPDILYAMPVYLPLASPATQQSTYKKPAMIPRASDISYKVAIYMTR